MHELRMIELHPQVFLLSSNNPSFKSNLISSSALVFAAAALFSASAPLAKILLGTFDPIMLAGFLYIGSGLGACLVLLAKRLIKKGHAAEAGITRMDVPWLGGAVVAGGIIAPILMMLGLAATPASTASILLNFEGVATVLLAALIFKEAVGKRIGIAIGLITLAAILFSWTGGHWGVSPAALAILGACFFWGLDNNFTRRISARDPLIIVAIKGLGAGSFSLLLALLLGRPFPFATSLPLALVLGAMSYGLSIELFILGLRTLGAARTATLYGVAPFLGAILSFILLHETPSFLFWIALPLMLAGAWLMVSERHRHVHTHPIIEHAHKHTHDDLHHDHLHAPGDEVEPGISHSHPHAHEELTHEHEHTPDLHHWHAH